METALTLRTQIAHRQQYDVFVVNNQNFAIVHEPLSSQGTLTVDLTDYNVILLAPIEAEKDISVMAQTIIVMSNVTSHQGQSKLLATGRLFVLGAEIKSRGDNLISGDMGIDLLPAILERKEYICQEMKEGLERNDPNQIVDALVEIVDAIKDPLGESEDYEIDLLESLSQLQITDEETH